MAPVQLSGSLEPQPDLSYAVGRQRAGEAQFSADLQHFGVARQHLPLDLLEPPATAYLDELKDSEYFLLSIFRLGLCQEVQAKMKTLQRIPDFF